MTPEHDREAERWEALIDREVVGESLSADELMFLREYEVRHPERAEERELWSLALDLLGDATVDAATDTDAELERLGAQALAAFRAERASEPEQATPLHRPRWRSLAAVAALAAAAGLVLWLGTRDDGARELGDADSSERPRQPEDPDPESDPPTPADSVGPVDPVDPVGRLSMRTTELELELGSAVEPGAKLSAPACVSWTSPIAVVCFEGALELPSASQPGQRRVHLGEGRLVAALDPLGPGQRFTVDTVLGSVTAIGTVFAVESHEGRVWVTVLEGQVELRDPSARVLEAGQRTSMRSEIHGDEPSPIQTTPTALAQLVGLAGLLRASPGSAQLLIPAQGELSLQLDSHALGRDGLQLSIAAGEHQLAVFDARGDLVGERALILDESKPFELAEVLASFDQGQPRVAPKQRTLSAKQLAEAAQRERAAGHHAQTASLYRALLEHYPDSPEAVNVPVRLGDLLASTGDHQGALQAYELYLERGAKQLAPEAEFGRILALRALGRHAEEAAAITAFLSASPDDHRRPELEARLAQLNK